MNLDKLRIQLNFSHIMSWPKPAALSLVAACYIVLCLILYLAINVPLNTYQKRNANMTGRLASELNDKQQRITAEKSINANDEIMGNPIELNKLQQQPLSHWLTQLVTLANKNHLEFDTIKPLPVEIAHHVWVQPIQMSTSGHYQQILDFFADLTHFATQNTLSDFNLKPLSSDADVNADEKTLQLVLTLNLYAKVNPS